MAGVEVTKANRLDPNVYSRSLGISLGELLRHHPGWTV
jgi:hypothetical protein